MKTLYQLSAVGENGLGLGKFTCKSKRVFDSREKAENYMIEFKKRCMDESLNPFVFAVDNDHFKIEILELEIE